MTKKNVQHSRRMGLIGIRHAEYVFMVDPFASTLHVPDWNYINVNSRISLGLSIIIKVSLVRE
jgi:hypothetical protein